MQQRSSTKAPKGLKVTVYTIKGDPNLKGWYNFSIWENSTIILSGAATAFCTPAEAKKVGISYAWDIFEGKSSWT